MKRKPLIYIASPYTNGDQFLNVKKQINTAEMIAQFDGVPVWPLSSAFWNMHYPHTWEFWIEQDKQLVIRCDALLRLSGDSNGADVEVQTAYDHGIEVFYDFNNLTNFIAGFKNEQ